jgi:nicotinamidase-related amidase
MTSRKTSYKGLLTPDNCTMIFIDHQPQMTFGVTSIDRQSLLNNTVALAKAAKVFKVPTILTTVETESFSGYMWPQLLEVFPGKQPIERTSMNSWEDQEFVDEVKRIGRKKLVIAALWTEVCLAFPALCALEDGYEVFAVEDASGGTSETAHRNAMDRMIQAGVKPVTWQQVMLEWQRDWARRESYDGVMAIVKQHSGAYGQGVDYAYTMVHKQKPKLTTAAE